MHCNVLLSFLEKYETQTDGKDFDGSEQKTGSFPSYLKILKTVKSTSVWKLFVDNSLSFLRYPVWLRNKMSSFLIMDDYPNVNEVLKGNLSII